MYDGKNVKTSDILHQFEYYLCNPSVKVDQVLNTTGDLLCYKYGDSEGDVKLNIKCPLEPDPTASSSASASPTPTVDLTGDWFLYAIKPLIPSEPKLKRRSHSEPIDNIEIETPNSNYNLGFTSRENEQVSSAIGLCDMNHIRHPPLADPIWLKMVGLDPDTVREYELFIGKSIDDINNQTGYISPAALLNWQKHNPIGGWSPSC
jgi:hypothetical protein